MDECFQKEFFLSSKKRVGENGRVETYTRPYPPVSLSLLC